MCDDYGLGGMQTTSYAYTLVDPIVVNGHLGNTNWVYTSSDAGVLHSPEPITDPNLIYIGDKSTSFADAVNTNLVASAFKMLEEFFHPGAGALDAADQASTFDRAGKEEVVIQDDQGGHHRGWRDTNDGSVWYDANNNGKPETHVQYINNGQTVELWADTDFNGTYDTYVSTMQ